jgi:hypothetical protein
MLVQKMTISGKPGKLGEAGGRAASPRPAQVLTQYFRGNQTRTEARDQVRIFDGQRELLLNPAKKTYVAVPKDAATQTTNAALSSLDIKADVTMKATGKAQLIQGKKAQQYLLTMALKLSPKLGAIVDPKSDPGKAPPISLKVELWTAEFAGVTPPLAVLGRSLSAGLERLPVAKDIAAKLKGIKGVALLTVATVQLGENKTTLITATTTLSEAPLPDSLFMPPPGYRQVPYEETATR